MISLDTLSERFFLKHKRLSDARVPSITKKIQFCSTFFVKIYSLSKSISDEQLNAIC